MMALLALRAALREVRAVRVHTLSEGELESGRPSIAEMSLQRPTLVWPATPIR